MWLGYILRTYHYTPHQQFNCYTTCWSSLETSPELQRGAGLQTTVVYADISGDKYIWYIPLPNHDIYTCIYIYDYSF